MSVIYTIISLAVTGSIMILLLRCLRPALRKHLPQWTVYLLYVVVVLRMLIPFSPEFSLMQRVYDGSVEHAQTQQVVPEYDAGTVAPQNIAAPNITQSQHITITAPENIPQQDNIVERQTFPWTVVLFGIWLAGAMIMFGRTVISYALFRRSIMKNSRRITVDGFNRLPALVTDAVVTPMLIGVTNPVILLPTTNMPEWQLRSALRHESAHYRRGDILVKWATEICCAVYWFNPLMPLLRREMNEACERACDEYVVRDMTSDERKQYIRTLMESASVQSGFCPLATAMTSGASRLKERLEDAMNYKRTTRAGLFMSLAAVALFAVAGLVLGACADNSTNKVTDEASQTSSADTAEKPFAAMYFTVLDDGQWVRKEVLDYDTAAKAAALLTPDESWHKYQPTGIDDLGNTTYDVTLESDEFGPQSISIYGHWFFQTDIEQDDLDVYITYPSDDKFVLPQQKCYRMPEENHRQLMELLRELENTAPDMPQRNAAEFLELWANDPHLNLTVFEEATSAYYQTFPVCNDGGVEELLSLIGDTEKWTEISYEDYSAIKPGSGAILSGYPGGEEQILIANGTQHVAVVGMWDKKYYTTPDEIYTKLKQYTIENAAIISSFPVEDSDNSAALVESEHLQSAVEEMENVLAAVEESKKLSEEAAVVINHVRGEHGLDELKIAEQSDGTGLYEAAMLRLEEIKESFSHTRPGGQDYTTAYEALAQDGTGFIELLGAGHQTPRRVVKEWLNTSHLAEKLLGDLTHMCLVSGQSDDGQIYWVLAAGKF